jgi:hypothetical protein
MRLADSKCSRSFTAALAILVAIPLMPRQATAAYITVHGGPSYTSPASAFAVVNDAGTAAATVSENNGPAPGTNFLFPSRAFRWNASGAPPVELGNLGTYVGSYSTRARAINNAGIIVGSASNTAGVPYRPVRWDPSGTAATALQGIDDNGTEPNYLLPGAAVAINDAGTAVGYTEHWAATYNYTHDHAARWSPSGTAVTALGHPGNADLLYTSATAINKAGTVIGFGEGGGHRWDPSGTLIQSLNGTPEAINDAGTVVGATYYYRAARWDAASETPTELDNLASGSYSYAWDINNAGTAVGAASPSSAGGTVRAVRWDAGGVAVTELGALSTLAYSYYVAAHVNDAGAIVGTASNDPFFQYPQYPTASTGRAIFWGLDGMAIDLNTLIDPQSGWTLTAAQGLSNTGWVVGTGTFDPDGPGGQVTSDRLFLMQVPAAVPEPSGVALISLAAVACLRRGRAVRSPLCESLEARSLLSFSAGVAASSGSFPVARDFNNDGRLDLATVTADATDRNVTVVLGNGDGTFRQTPPLRTALGLGPPDSSSAYPLSLSAADFNRDGKLDLAVAIVRYDTFENEVRILLGNGAGTFAAALPVPVAQGYWSVLAAVGDLNGDGAADLVSTSNNDPWSFDSEILEVRLGRGDGTFAYSGPYYSDDLDLDLYQPELADFNGDGRLDVAVPAINRNGSSVRVYLGNGNGSLQVPPREVIYPYRVPYPEPLVSGDFNGDGRADLVADSTVLLSNGAGTFRTAGTIGGGSFLAKDAGDINADGRPDAVVWGDGLLSVMLNDGVWTTPKSFIGPGGAGSGGNWSTAANWSPAGVPAAGDFVTISGTSVNLAASATVAGLTLTGGATVTLGTNGGRVLRTSTLSISSNSKLNLNDNDLVIDYAAGTASPIGSWNGASYTGIAGLIQSARNDGTWNGNGVTTSMAEAAAGRTGLGVAEAAAVLGISGGQTEMWNGRSVDATTVLVKYTYAGDANLDGVIDGGDYGIIDNFVQVPSPLRLLQR